MATVAVRTAGSTTGSAWVAEQHSAVRDQALTGFPMQRYIALVTNTLQASNVETLAPTVLTSSTLREMDVTEINDLLMITESITTVRANCEEQKSTAVSTEWLPTIPTPQSPINCFSLSALHARRTGNWRALKMAETLFPNCKLPHCSYTHTEYDCYTKVSMETVEILTGITFSGDVVTTAQTAQTVCFACSLTTAQEIMSTGAIPLGLFVNQQLSALLKLCQMHWSGIATDVDEQLVILCFNRLLNRYLTSSNAVHNLTTNFVDEGRTLEALTAFNRLYMDHCWTTGSSESDVSLNITECRSAFGILLPFAARDLVEPLQTELNCTQLFGTHCRGLVGHCILTVSHLQLMRDGVCTECTWKSLYTEDSLPKMTSQERIKFTGQDDTDHTDPRGRHAGLVNVEIAGLPITTDGVKLTITGSQRLCMTL